MSSMVKFSFKGGNEMIRSLERMEHKTRRNVVTRASRKALAPFRLKLQQSIKSQLLTMNATARALYAKQIYLSFKVERGNILAGNIRTRNKVIAQGNKKTKYSALAHIFEGGASPHKIYQPKLRRTIKHPGIKATPIWSSEFDDNAAQIIAIFGKAMFDEIEKEWRKGK